MTPPGLKPRLPLMISFGHWRSGWFTNGMPGAASRVTSVRQDPNSAAPGIRFLVAYRQLRVQKMSRSFEDASASVVAA